MAFTAAIFDARQNLNRRQSLGEYDPAPCRGVRRRASFPANVAKHLGRHRDRPKNPVERTTRRKLAKGAMLFAHTIGFNY